MTKPDELIFNNTYQQLPPAFYRHVAPSPLPNARIASFNADAALLLGIDENTFRTHNYLDYINGVCTFAGSRPIATVYAGHQFGVLVSQLGDGRAILLGELQSNAGEKWDVQIKGGGLTPFSRMGDGRAVLRSTLREYLCGEAMHALGIPTTRGLCVLSSDEPVYRETTETAALLVRLARTHIRFGHFEFFYYQNDFENLERLLNYVIAQHYSAYSNAPGAAALFFADVVKRTAHLMAQWQAVGFTHGVMNTDNFSIIGDTLDYGPFGFMEAFTPSFTPNHSDHQGRYAYHRQPAIGQWNCACLAQALTPFIEKEQLISIIDSFDTHFIERYSSLLLAKFGLTSFLNGDQALLDDIFKLMHDEKTDFTIFFRALSHFCIDSENLHLHDLFIDRDRWKHWAARYAARLKQESTEEPKRHEKMLRTNPKYILRKHLAQLAIEHAQHGDFSEVDRLLLVLQTPFDEHPNNESYALPPPAWADEIELSCSS